MEDSTFEDYPKTVKSSKWVAFLGRSLEPFENGILYNVLFEKKFNKRMIGLYENCTKHNYFVPQLTNLYGNCLFECLVFHGIGKSVTDLRKGLAYLMYQYRDYKGFFEERDETLKELYILFTNQDEYVYCKQDNKLYKYTYEIMCQDLATDCSWGNLHAELLFLVISRIFNIQFEIIANEFDKITYRHAFKNGEEKNDLAIIRLGHIFENHYVPIGILYNDADFAPLFYNAAKIEFHKWGTIMAKVKRNAILEKLSGIKQADRAQHQKADKIKLENSFSFDQFMDMSNC